MGDYLDKAYAIMEWAESKSKFDTEFVESIIRQLEEGKEASSSQETAIDNIIDGFRIAY